MPGTSTIYDVKVRYALDKQSNAKDGLNGIAAAADKAQQKTMSLKGAIAAVGAGALIMKAKSALIDFNSEMDQLKIGMSTIMQLQLKMPFEKANKEADKLFFTFQELAKKSPATTKDFMEMASAIAAPIAMLGGGPDKLAKLTQGAVIAGQAFGERADVVALDIKQMLMGTVSLRDRVAQQLLASKGMDHLEFNKKSGMERASITEELLQAEPLKKAADAMGESFKGQVSTFQDMLQITLGQVGKPLMESLTSEVKKWNTWIEKHPKTIAQIADRVGGMIRNVFGFVKDAAGWLVDHSDLLLQIGKTFLIFKGAQMGTNVIKGFVGGVTNLVTNMKTAGTSLVGMVTGAGGAGVGGAFRGLVGILSGAGGVIPALGLFVGALGIVSELLNDHAEADKKGREAAMSLHEATGDIPGLMDRRRQLEMQVKNPAYAGTRDQDMAELEATRSKLFNPESLGLALRKIDEASVSHGGGSLKNLSLADMQNAYRMMPDTFDSRNVAENTKIMREVEATLKMFNSLGIEERREVLKNAWADRWGDPQSKPEVQDMSKWINPPGKSDVNVTIQKIEVASDDPDRFVHGVVSAAEQIANNPTQAQSVIVGGF